MEEPRLRGIVGPFGRDLVRVFRGLVKYRNDENA